MEQLAKDKADIRRKAMAGRGSLTTEERRLSDLKIQEHLFTLPVFKEARSILFYASFKSEVNTELMIVQALDDGKTVLLPKAHSDGKRITKHIITGLHEISTGYKGIPEPMTDSQMKVEDIDLLIIPGVAFDPAGGRVGYGEGFYDRLLHRAKGMYKIIALAFSVQMFSGVPTDAHDVPMDFIITEERVINCNGK